MDISFEKEETNVRHVNDNRRYWFIRTYAGQTYNNFVRENYVGIGFNNVPFNYIENTKTGNVDAYNTLRTFIKNEGLPSAEATKWTNQLITFQHEINNDDIVIIPSEYSERLAIGKVISGTYVVDSKNTFKFRGKFEKFPEKRRKIEWITSKDKHAIQNELRSAFFNHQAVINLTQYSEMIEGYVSSMFIKENRIHLVIEIKKDEEINTFHLNRFLTTLTYFYNEFCVEANIEPNEDLTIKIKVQSRGKMALKAFGYAGLIGIGGLLTLANNTELNVDLKNMSIQGKSDGFLKSLTDFLDADQRRRIEYEKFQDSLKYLQATRPSPEPVLYEDASNDSKEKGEEKNTENNSQ